MEQHKKSRSSIIVCVFVHVIINIMEGADCRGKQGESPTSFFQSDPKITGENIKITSCLRWRLRAALCVSAGC